MPPSLQESIARRDLKGVQAGCQKETPTKEHLRQAAGTPNWEILQYLCACSEKTAIKEAFKTALQHRLWKNARILADAGRVGNYSQDDGVRMSRTRPPKQREFWEACMKGDLEKIKGLGEGYEINDPGWETNALSATAYSGRPEQLEWLLGKGLNPHMWCFPRLSGIGICLLNKSHPAATINSGKTESSLKMVRILLREGTKPIPADLLSLASLFESSLKKEDGETKIRRELIKTAARLMTFPEIRETAKDRLRSQIQIRFLKGVELEEQRQQTKRMLETIEI